MSEINWVDNPEDSASKAFVGSTCDLRGRVFRDGEDGPGVYVALVRSPIGHWEQQSEHEDMASAKAAVEKVLREWGYISQQTAAQRVAALEVRVSALEAQVARMFRVNDAGSSKSVIPPTVMPSPWSFVAPVRPTANAAGIGGLMTQAASAQQREPFGAEEEARIAAWKARFDIGG